MDDDEAMLESMLKEGGMWESMGDEHMEHMEDEHMGHEHMEEHMEVAMDDDPMGVMDTAMDDDEMMVLAQLHPEMADKLAGSKVADDDDDDDDDDDEEVEVEVEEEGKKKAGKTAAERTAEARAAKPRPQPRTASTGATRLGGVSKAASSEITDLEKLWKSAPDVSSHF